MDSLFLGVDVGTGSARAGLFDARGALLGAARRPIRLWHEDGSIVEQSSADIWAAVCDSVREALRLAGVAGRDVKGVGFDATCSLVVLDAQGRSLPVGPSEDPQRDVVVWMDHRAIDQARRINATGHPVLRYVGGAVSPEMETPKLLWLKENRPAVFAKAGHFFDLADYLSWRATGSLQRSVCTLTCKWTYLAHAGGWDAGFLREISLGELAADGFARIGADVVDIGTPLGRGLTREAAQALGLEPGTPIGASLIDAHAGAVGTLGSRRLAGEPSDPANELALILGTSSCAMAVTREPAFVDGVWGPYFRALLPGTWMLEGGQSAYGAALDHLVSLHPAATAAREEAERRGLSLLDHLEARAVAMAGSADEAARLARDIHIVPEFLGNRSPEADPAARAALAGLTLEAGGDHLVRLFVAGLCGLSYGTRQIVEAMREKGVGLGAIVASGGASRSPLLRRILSDATGLAVALPQTREPVLLGSAMVGSVAAGAYPDLSAAADAMCRIGEETRPSAAMTAFHGAKFEAFEALQRAERETRRIMARLG
ncbi:FGGY-family carbohydrate kinase [Antarcticirhabdus aurantiaca]|uniref:FGGY-family carbohydrate kinase n=1 Tax=Antarcticirhabdus aurantiaca TaxID=2606717 RepID=A0ACD4NKM4_9HYPH|nr:FGGY-family carbohydrate kinase [Antarcticirhabdus aurantiaca]WAJ27317.1 FGGY-family carbohydrate kinase [Jeongeuplla avenae]